MEFLWTGSQSLGNASELFTLVLHTHYSAPQGYDWEEGSPHVNTQNVQERARYLVQMMKVSKLGKGRILVVCPNLWCRTEQRLIEPTTSWFPLETISNSKMLIHSFPIWIK